MNKLILSLVLSAVLATNASFAYMASIYGDDAHEIRTEVTHTDYTQYQEWYYYNYCAGVGGKNYGNTVICNKQTTYNTDYSCTYTNCYSTSDSYYDYSSANVSVPVFNYSYTDNANVNTSTTCTNPNYYINYQNCNAYVNDGYYRYERNGCGTGYDYACSDAKNYDYAYSVGCKALSYYPYSTCYSNTINSAITYPNYNDANFGHVVGPVTCADGYTTNNPFDCNYHNYRR